MPVRVFYNLTRGCWSIQHRVPGKGWRLLRHADVVTLRHCTPKVYEAGRLRTLREGKKYVHAFLEGELHPVHLRRGFLVSYNPRKGGQFFYKGSPLREAGAPFAGADRVTLESAGRVLASA